MKKSTKITGLILLVCMIGIGIIGFSHQRDSASSSVSPSKDSDFITITITGVDETILDHEEVSYQSQTVYDVLKEVCDENHIAISTKGTGSLIYISAIDDLSEFDYGGNSGWTYTVNGEYPPKSCGAYTLEEGDEIEWIYVYE